MFILLLLLLVGESSLEDEFSFTKMYCSQVMSCCYGPGSDFQVAYETYPQGERSTKSVIMQLTGKRQKPIGIEIHYYSLCFLEHDDTVGACLEFYYGEHFPKKLYIQTVIGSHEATESRINHLIDGVRLHESDKYFQILWLTQLEFQNDEDQFSLKKLHRLQLKRGRGKYLPNRTILASDVESTICKDPFQLDNHGQRSFDCSIQLVLLCFTMGLSLRFLFISI